MSHVEHELLAALKAMVQTFRHTRREEWLTDEDFKNAIACELRARAAIAKAEGAAQ